ncbi:hypothetical protein D3C71_1937680 [compost metagenome]
MVGQKRHVRYHKGGFGAPGNSFGMMDHIVKGNRYRGIIAQHHISQGVSDQNAVHSRFLSQLSRGIVIGCQESDWYPILFHFTQF